MSIQSSINQTLGVAAIATKLSPQLQELGDEVRTNTESNRVERQLKKLASKGSIEYDTKTNEPVAVLDDKNAFKYQSLVAKKKMLDQKKMNLGLKPTDWGEFPSDVLALDEAADLEKRGKLQREKVEKQVKEYDFARPSKFSKEHLRTLEIIFEHYGRLLSTNLPVYLRKNVQVEVMNSEAVTYSEFSNASRMC